MKDIKKDQMTSIKTCRDRWLLFFGFIAVVVLGLASRRFPAMFPAFLGKYPGDSLWALMVFIGWAFIKPRASTTLLAVLAISTSYSVEFSQLYQAVWINAIRSTTLGHLALGSTFMWLDIVAYTIGILIGTFLDVLLHDVDSPCSSIGIMFKK